MATTADHLLGYASQGLRTLTMAYRELASDEHALWLSHDRRAISSYFRPIGDEHALQPF